MEGVLVATSIAAVTEFVKRFQAGDWKGALVIVLAALIGALGGWLGVQGLGIETGIIAGLGVAGIHTIAKQVG